MLAEWLAGLLGAIFVASLAYQYIYVEFGEDWKTDSDVRDIFGGDPEPNSPSFWRPVLIDALVSSFVYGFVVSAIVDPNNMAVDRFIVPVLIGLAMTTVGYAFGGVNGVAVDPVSELAPRILATILGVKYSYGWLFLVTFVLYHLGTIVGVFTYFKVMQNEVKQFDKLTYPGRFSAEDTYEMANFKGRFGNKGFEDDAVHIANYEYLLREEEAERRQAYVDSGPTEEDIDE